MKSNHWSKVNLTAALMLAVMITATAQDWPQWRGMNRDGKVEAFTPPARWPGDIVLQWRDSVGTGDATPILIGNMLYVFSRQGEQEVILCLDAEKGGERWRYAYDAPPVTGAGARHPGPRSTPVVSDGKIVALGASGILTCLNVNNGSLLWKKEPFPGVVPMFFTSMSPLVKGGVCVVQLGGPGNGAMIAYDLGTGDEKWRWAGEGPDYGSPVLLAVDGTVQVVTPTEKSIVGVNLADGKLLWNIPFVPQRRAYNAATPIVDGNRVIYTGAGRGTTAVKIEKKGDKFVPTQVWSNPEVSVQFNTPVLKDGLLFGYSSSGYLFCLDALDGGTAWIDTVNHDRSGFASILDAGQVVVALPASGEMIIMEPVKGSYTELGKLKVADLPTYAHPVMAGNRLFIRDEKTITLWTLK